MMARQLDSMPDCFMGSCSFDYDAVFDGKPWELKHGEDFNSRMQTFQSSLHQAARRRNLRLRTRIIDQDTIVILAVPR